MTVEIIETIPGSASAGTTASASITTSLVATDRVVVSVARTGVTGAPSVSGLGATWAVDASITSARDTYIFSAAGAIGGGTVSVTAGSTYPADFTVYVLRSSAAVTPHLVSGDAGWSGSQTANVPYALTPSTVADANSIVIACGSATPGLVTFPAAGSSPASGWVIDHTASFGRGFIHRSMDATELVDLAIVSASNYNATLARCVYWDDTTPTPPSVLDSTFIGWGVDAGIA